MSIHHQHIILYGWRIPYDTADSWHWEERENWSYFNKEQGEVGIVFDGMNGDYALVGILQYISKDSRDAPSPGIPLTTLDEPSEEELHDLYSSVYKELDLDPSGEAEHYVLTHYK